MDLLGSILGSMEKPPTVNNEAKKKQREQKEKMEKLQARERQVRSSFRLEIQTRINRFLQNDLEGFRFEPMDKLQRAIVHEVAETAGISSFAFGVEEEDRFVMLFKKEFAPTEEQLVIYRSGTTYDPAEVSKILTRREEEKRRKMTEEEEAAGRGKKKKNADVEGAAGVSSSSDYHNKYQHLIGTDSAAAAAKSMNANASYGFVTSENKKDKRSIEETLADIRSKKRLKTGEGDGAERQQPDAVGEEENEDDDDDDDGASKDAGCTREEEAAL